MNDDTIDPVDTPCTKYLAIDEGGELAHGDFKYQSIVRQLNYLQSHLQPDITMAVSQCVCFVHSPKRSHELALLRIGQYLKGTSEQGLILQPKDAMLLKTDFYVNASFACGSGVESSANPDCVKSCTGYIIKIASCPVLWVSVMQTTIATSTMESEYTALSQACRAVIPLLAVINSTTNGLSFTKRKQLTFKATIHEDNMGGALILSHLRL